MKTKSEKIIKLLETSENVKRHEWTLHGELYIEFKDGFETVVDFEEDAAWWNESLDDIIKRLEPHRPETKKTPFQKVSTGDFINYDIKGLQGYINLSATILEKTETHVTILDKNGKAHYTKDYFNNNIYNLTVILDD